MTRELTRRALLVGSAGVAAGAVVSQDAFGAESPAVARRPGAGPKRVVVLGAGLAGLCAAHEIIKARPGVEVVVLEARPRVGGRVWTVTADQSSGEPFDDGQYAELGAQRIPDSHRRVLRYVKDFGLSGRLRAFGGPATKYVIGTEQFLDGDPWPQSLALSDFERSVSLNASAYEYEYKYAVGRKPPRGNNGIGDVAVPRNGTSPFPEDAVGELISLWESQTLQHFHESHGASADWLRIYQATNGTDAARVGAVPWLVQVALDWKWQQTLYLDGGLSQLPEAFVGRIQNAGVSIRINHAVSAIRRLPTNQVEVAYQHGAETQTVVADEVICTIPLPVLAETVDLSEAGLYAEQLEAIENTPMVPASRIVLQQQSRFVWQSEGVEGLFLAYTDRAIERLMHSTNTQTGVSGIVQAYLQAENAVAAPEVETLEWANQEIADNVFPLADDPSLGWNGKGWAQHWHLDPWSRGAWSSPGPDQFTSSWWWWRSTPERDGPVHFAGEHTSLYAGWMEGALESGQRAARDVLDRL